jgi:ABC-2 type transport system permease protein
VHIAPRDWPLFLGVIVLVSVLFSALGLIFGLLAEKFDQIAILTTFVITPLTFVGGVFTSAEMLPPVLRRLQLFNPIFYTIDAFRRSYTGYSYLSPAFSIAMIVLLAAIALAVILRLTAIGYKLRT